MTDTPPDRLSLDPRSDHYDEDPLSRGVGIKFNGQEKTNVIDVHVARLRSKLRDGEGTPRIATVRGVGFMMTAGS